MKDIPYINDVKLEDVPTVLRENTFPSRALDFECNSFKSGVLTTRPNVVFRPIVDGAAGVEEYGDQLTEIDDCALDYVLYKAAGVGLLDAKKFYQKHDVKESATFSTKDIVGRAVYKAGADGKWTRIDGREIPAAH